MSWVNGVGHWLRKAIAGLLCIFFLYILELEELV
jgi:hypothetical protein